jgi:hypothetical protein
MSRPEPAALAATASGALEALKLRRHRLAANVPNSASAEHNPSLTRGSVLGRFLETWESIFVLCYRESCRVHTPAGDGDGRRVWWPSIQRRVVIFDAADLDQRNADIIAWAGCNVANAPAGRSGEVATREPCRFAGPGGGGDWRRTAKHRLMALLAHLTLVEEASRRNLTRIMILEADAVSSLANEELSSDQQRASAVSRELGRAFASGSTPWSVLRLSGIFYSQEYAPRVPSGTSRRCSLQCRCVAWAGGRALAAVSRFPMLCHVAADPTPSDTILPMVKRLNHWCDIRDTSAYAVHQTAYGEFSALLRRLRGRPAWLRDGANHVPAIDNWLPHAIPSVYALPTLVSQPYAANDSQGATALMRQTSARQFAQWCAGGGESAGPGTAVGRSRSKPMKLAAFATRHIYLMKEPQ